VDDPLACGALDLGVQPRDLAVPADRDIGLFAAPERDPRLGLAVERDDALALEVVTQNEERPPGALGDRRSFTSPPERTAGDVSLCPLRADAVTT